MEIYPNLAEQLKDLDIGVLSKYIINLMFYFFFCCGVSMQCLILPCNIDSNV